MSFLARLKTRYNEYLSAYHDFGDRYNAKVSSIFYAYGVYISRYPSIFFAAFAIVELGVILGWALSGLGIPLETELEKLWVESGGRLSREAAYTESRETTGFETTSNFIMLLPKSGDPFDTFSSSVLNSTQFILQSILDIVIKLQLENDTVVPFSYSGAFLQDEPGRVYNNTVFSLCNTLPFPLSLFDATKVNASESREILDTRTPCSRITALDCFIEGGEDFFFTTEDLNDMDQTVRGIYGIQGYDGLPSFVNNTILENIDIAGCGCAGYASTVFPPLPGTLYYGSTPATDPTRQALGCVEAAEAVAFLVLMGSPELIAQKLNDPNIPASEVRRAQLAFNIQLERLVTEWAVNDTVEAADVYILGVDSLNIVLDAFNDDNIAIVGIGYTLMGIFITASQYRRNPKYNYVFYGLLGLLVVLFGNIFTLAILVLFGVRLNSTVLQVLPFLVLGLGVDDVFVLLSYYRNARIQHPEFATPKIIGFVLSEAGISVTLTSVCNTGAFLVATVIPLPAVQVFCLTAGVAVIVNYIGIVVLLPSGFALGSTKIVSLAVKIAAEPTHDSKGDIKTAEVGYEEANLYHSYPDSYLCRFYLPFLADIRVRTASVIAFVICTILGGIGSAFVPDGLDAIDIVPSDTEYFRSSEVINSFITTFPSQVVTTEIAYWDPSIQERLILLMADMNDLEFASGANSAWLNAFLVYLNDTVGDNYTREQFNGLLQLYLNPQQITYVFAYQLSMLQFGFTEEDDLDYAFFTFNLAGGDTDLIVQGIEEVRAYLSDRCQPGNGLEWCYPQGAIFSFWEQYIGLRRFFFLGIGCSTAVIFFVSIVALFDVRIATILSIFSFCIVMQVFGLLLPIDVSFSAIPAVTLVMSIGLSVEYTAHTCASFYSAKGDRLERMKECLFRMFWPVLQGGVSSILGFLGLAFSPFPFVVQYYFYVYLLVGVVGVVNGLIFLPSVLSFFGPSD